MGVKPLTVCVYVCMWIKTATSLQILITLTLKSLIVKYTKRKSYNIFTFSICVLYWYLQSCLYVLVSNSSKSFQTLHKTKRNISAWTTPKHNVLSIHKSNPKNTNKHNTNQVFRRINSKWARLKFIKWKKHISHSCQSQVWHKNNP